MSIKKVLILMADGFEEIETVTVIDMLRRADIEVVSASIGELLLKGSRGIRVAADSFLYDLDTHDFDAIVIPGGQPGVDHLKKDPQVLSVLKSMHAQGAWIASLCAGPLVLKEAGLLNGVTLTSFPGVAASFNASSYSEDRVVVDGKIVTSRSPGTAMEFSLILIEKLCGKEKSQALAATVLALGY